MKKEFIIFMIVLVVLAVGMHPDFLTSPLERLGNFPAAGAYGLGMMHPFVFAFAGYLFILFLRGIWKVFAKLFGRKEA